MRPVVGVALSLLFFAPSALAVTSSPGLTEKSYLLVGAPSEGKILRFDAHTGQFVDEFVTPFSGGIIQPTGMALGPDGNLYVASAVTGQIFRYDGKTGAFLDTLAPIIHIPIGIDFGPDGDLFVAARDEQGIIRIDADTGAKSVFATASGGDLWWAWDIDVRGDGKIYLSSFEREKVLHFDLATGAYLGVFANGSNNPALGRAGGFDFGPDGDLFLGGYVGSVVRFDGATGALEGTFLPLTSDDAATVTFGPTGEMFVALSNRGSVLRVNGSTGAVQGELTAPVTWSQSLFMLVTVPEPGALSLLATIGLVTAALRRRRRVSTHG